MAVQKREPDRATAPAGGRKTGPKASFTAKDVVAHVWELGVASFTLSQVAQRLGVSTPALYRVFDSREDIMIAAVSDALDTLPTTIPATTVRDYLHFIVEEMWEFCELHREFSQAMWTNTAVWPTFVSTGSALAAGLHNLGVSLGEAYFGLDILVDTVISTHFALQSLPTGHDIEDLTDAMKKMFQGTEAAATPEEFAAISSSLGPRGFLDAKIDFLIDSLLRRWGVEG